MARSAIVGSERVVLGDAHVLGPSDPQKRARVTVHVRRQDDPQGAAFHSLVDDLVSKPTSQRQHLTREDYASRFGARPADFAQVRRFARERGLRVVPDATLAKTRGSQAAHATVELEGSLGALQQAFGVRFLRARDSAGRTYRTYQGAVQVPSGYSAVIRNVLGLDTRPQTDPRFRPKRNAVGFEDASSEPAYSPEQVATFYNFPKDLTGKGQTVALLEFGGGFRRSDLRTYFRRLGLRPPHVLAIGVGSATNAPDGNPDGPDGEVMLDLEVLGVVAPSARIVVYFAPNTSRGFLRAINAAIHDDLHRPSVLSISWGGPETTWTRADIQSIDDALRAAAALGVSVFVAAGDAGSSDGLSGGRAHVDFPASSPFSTACGGTRMIIDETGALTDEVVWNDADQGGTGGGVSAVFPIPPWQTGPAINVPPSINPGGQPGRGVPDVAGNADPVTGYQVRIDGVDTVVGGTSAVAPLWAGLFARLNEGAGAPVGFANTLLYSVVASTPGALRDVVEGDNDLDGAIGGYAATSGWDPCTGLGSPLDGTKIFEAVKSI